MRENGVGEDGVVREGPGQELSRAARGATFAVLLCLLAASGVAAQTTAELASGSSDMIGQVAPTWQQRGWVNSEPVEPGQFQGRVVLLRFFTDQPVGAKAVRDLYRAYREQGLSAVGIYVPTPMPTSTDSEMVRRLAIAMGFDFPVAVDPGWETVNRYWLDRADAEPGAATFLIDRRGIIRYIQPDGRYEKDSRDRVARRAYENLEKQVQLLLQEEPPQ